MKKSSIIVIVILSLVILGLCVFIAYDKNLLGIKGENKKESNTVEKEQKVEEVKEKVLDVNSEQVTSLISKITYNTNNLYTSGTKYFGYYFQNDKLNSEDIDDDVILYTALKKYFSEKNITSYYEGNFSVSKNDIVPIIKEIFGNVEYENKTIKITACDPGTFIYDDNTGTYTVESHGCGGVGTSLVNYKITDAVKKNNTIEITLAIVYATCGYEQQSADIPGHDYCTFGNSVDENQKVRAENALLRVNADNHDSRNYDELFDFNTYIDKLNKYKFTFTKDNNNYIFKKVEKV